MAQVDIHDLLVHARASGYSLSAFCIQEWRALKQVIRAAEQLRAPVVLTVSGADHALWDLETLLPAVEAAARNTSVPVGIALLDAPDPDTVTAAIRLGCNGVMVPDTLQHSSFLDELLTLPQRCGIALIDADSAKVITISRSLSDHAIVDSFQQGGSVGQGQALLAKAKLWAPVEHLIIYNVSTGDDQEVERIMAQGRVMLGTIPGVKAVFTGRAIKEDSRYRYTWLVRFVHPNVIDSYRDHPLHVKFADTLFRPIAGDRISIDFQEVALL